MNNETVIMSEEDKRKMTVPQYDGSGQHFAKAQSIFGSGSETLISSEQAPVMFIPPHSGNIPSVGYPSMMPKQTAYENEQTYPNFQQARFYYPSHVANYNLPHYTYPQQYDSSAKAFYQPHPQFNPQQKFNEYYVNQAPYYAYQRQAEEQAMINGAYGPHNGHITHLKNGMGYYPYIPVSQSQDPHILLSPQPDSSRSAYNHNVAQYNYDSGLPISGSILQTADKEKEESKSYKSKRKPVTHYKMKPKTFIDDKNKIDTDKNTIMIERIKRSLLKNRQGRPITLDLSVNVTLYDCLEDYILHFMRKNYNLEYWFSQDASVNNESVTSLSRRNDSDDDLTSKLKKETKIDTLKNGDQVNIENLNVLKYLYLKKNKLMDSELDCRLPVTKTKIMFDPRVDQFPCFPKIVDKEGNVKINVFKKFKTINQPSFAKNTTEKGESCQNDLNDENTCVIKKAQILYSMGSGEESILDEIKKRLNLNPNQKLAVLKQYKRSMFAENNEDKVGNGTESKVVMFDFLPIINEKEVNIEFFKKIICFPKYRTNYDLVLIKMGGNEGLQQFSSQIRCYFDRSLYEKAVAEYKSIKQDLYKYYVLKDINTALIGTMILNYSDSINYQLDGEEEGETPTFENKNETYWDFKGEFTTLSNGLEVFEHQPSAVWQKEKTKYMCYDTWVLDIK
ncbi:hypothetical protein QEN19_000504 [Hanseniaspora menglaensis]